MDSTDDKKKRPIYTDADGIKRVAKGNSMIYLLKLHETTMIGNNTVVLRVPSGWIYTQTVKGFKVRSTTSTFVPYSDEYYNL
jgi:hypothetical protein